MLRDYVARVNVPRAEKKKGGLEGKLHTFRGSMSLRRGDAKFLHRDVYVRSRRRRRFRRDDVG